MEHAIVLIASYVIIMIIVSGITGGAREETVGILDLFVIVFWPIALVWMINAFIIKRLRKFGAWIGEGFK